MASNRTCTSACRKRWNLTKVKSLKSFEDLRILEDSTFMTLIFSAPSSTDQTGWLQLTGMARVGRTWGGWLEEVWSRRAGGGGQRCHQGCQPWEWARARVRGLRGQR